MKKKKRRKTGGGRGRLAEEVVRGTGGRAWVKLPRWLVWRAGGGAARRRRAAEVRRLAPSPSAGSEPALEHSGNGRVFGLIVAECVFRLSCFRPV